MGATARSHDELRGSRLREGVLRRLDVAESHRIETFAPGEAVFRQGDPPDRLYLILQDQPRTASVRAVGELRVASLVAACSGCRRGNWPLAPR